MSTPAFSDEELAVQWELADVLKGAAADSAYAALDGAFAGRLLNADLARELSPRYRSVADRLRFTRATYPSAAQYVLRRFHATIGMPGTPGSRSVLFLGGGAASGKTTSVGRDVILEYDLVFDSNLADVVKASTMIDEALRGGWFVSVRYIHRPFDLAVESMLQRARETGRYIPMGHPSRFASLHFNAQRTVVALRDRYAAEPRVTVAAIANLWRPRTQLGPVPIAVEDLAPGGKFSYTSVEELHAVQSPILERFRRGGAPPDLVEAVCGTVG
jgi:hypothetical protein